MNEEEILKFDKKQIIPIIVCITITIISIIIFFLSSEFNFVAFITAFGSGVWTLPFAIIYLTNLIKSKSALKKYNIDEVKNELKSESAIKLDGNMWLTDNYIISNTKVLYITKYSDINQIYINKQIGYGGVRIGVSIAEALYGMPLVAVLNNGNKKTVGMIKSRIELDLIYNKIAKSKEL